MESSITVLLSTYNGEKFIQEQIDSILVQKNVEIKILVRDDGSSDNTCKIIENYKDNRITLISGQNLGPKESFFELVKIANGSDYYAFCDQDDVWDDVKLSTAINMLQDVDKKLPAMYYSNLKIVDENLKFYRYFLPDTYRQEEKYSVLIENMAAGCTIVFNNTAIEMMREKKPSYFIMHDAWLHLICSFFGIVIYDSKAWIYYRQHSNNAVGTYKRCISIKKICQKILRIFDKSIQPRRDTAINFLDCYGDKLSAYEVREIRKLSEYKATVLGRFKLLIDPNFKAPLKKRDISYRILVILGIA